jgi:thioredoxin reductase (NADPH)
MSETEMYDLIIIGGGPGGLTAGIYAMRAALKTLLIEMGSPGGQVNNSDSVENWPGDEHIGGAELSMKFSQHAQSYGLEIRSAEVTELKPGQDYHTIKLADGSTLGAYAVILATGGHPRKLKVPGEDQLYGQGVSYCAVCDGFFFRDKTVVVVGGGDAAVEESLYLAKLAKQVYIVHRRDELRAGAILQQRIKAECNVEILWNSVVTAIKADISGVCAVDLKDTQTGEQRELATDGVFIFIGHRPNTELFAEKLTLNAQGYIVVDGLMQAGVEGVYAAGEVADPHFRQVITSAGMGAGAAIQAIRYLEEKGF